jgi:F420H(2)-dependent quinone reductase
LANLFLKLFTAAHRTLYRLTGGKIGGKLGKAPVLLLTTTGRKSGKSRTVPLNYTREGSGYVLIGSVGGAPHHPAWYLNLRANPNAEVTIRRDHVQVAARDAEGEERERLWRAMTDLYPGYDAYQAKTERPIPVVVLEPRS